MSVWPECGSPSPVLRGAEGELVSVRISIEPRLLEQLLETLAGLEFPINPQIYHDARTVYVYPDGTSATFASTVVEFPAWARRLGEVRTALGSAGLGGADLSVRNMLEDLHADRDEEQAPPDAPYRVVVRYKRPARASA